MRDKQIDDLAEKIREIKEYITDRCGTTYGERYVTVSHSERIAKHLLDASYRKASDVADELINTALSKIQIMISAIKAQEESGNISEFNGGAKTALEIVLKDLAELKKKYTEGEG